MRNAFIKIAVCVIAAIIPFIVFASDRKWEEVPGGLPYYQYTGAYDDDPAFLVGNSRIKIRSHVSGIYELISGERSWARFNADPSRPDYGRNSASVVIDNKEIELVGLSSLAMRPGKCDVYSGAGFVRYDYDLGEGIRCSRMISVMPSHTPDGGTPLFLVTMTFTNNGSGAKKIEYEEAVAPYFLPSAYQYMPENDRPLRYHMSTDISFRCVTASFGPIPQQFVQFAVPQNRSKDEFSPQSVFLYCDKAFLVVNDGQLKAMVDEFRLRPRKQHTFHIVIGFSGEDNKKMAEEAVSKAETSSFGAFASMWKSQIPDFSAERNKDVRHELYRCAYMIEASEVYSDYFKESFIPGKFQYSTRFGENVSNSDHIDAALQACCTHPALAKSIIRYVMKQTSYDGMIPDSNKGYGYIPSDGYNHNLVQLEVMNAVAEYLKRTEDYAFLDEWLTVYPVERGEMQSVKAIIERYFLYLRDLSYTSSSLSAMQAAILPRFVEQIEKSGKFSAEFISALATYTASALEQFENQAEYDLSALPYLLEAKALNNYQKRELLDEAIENGTVDIRSIPGLATFDGIEASSLFRSLVKKNMESDDADVMDAMMIYSYFRLME